jgi:hypothetical protein
VVVALGGGDPVPPSSDGAVVVPLVTPDSTTETHSAANDIPILDSRLDKDMTNPPGNSWFLWPGARSVFAPHNENP